MAVRAITMAKVILKHSLNKPIAPVVVDDAASFPVQFLPAGQSAEIVELAGAPDDVHRLNELGLRVGVQVSMLQSGSPCILKLAGQKLGFRADENAVVLVRPGKRA